MAIQKYEGPDQFQRLDIPAEIIRIIFLLLPIVQQAKKGKKKDVETLSILALTCHLFYNMTQTNRLMTKFVDRLLAGKQTHSVRLFQLHPEFNFEKEEHHFEPKLLECSVGANQEQMQRLLTLLPALAAKKHLFTDWSGRTFNCSVFEYAFWTTDVKYMCPMILDCLPKNAAGETIRIELKKQAQEILANGLSYQLKDKPYKEKFFSLEPLKQALKTYSDGFNDWDEAQRKQHWCTDVGAEQVLLTAYIRQHYCDPEDGLSRFTPTFTKEQFTRSLNFINEARNNAEQIWDSMLSGLGVDFAISGAFHARRGTPSELRRMAMIDFAAITELAKVRTETDLPLLMQRLENPLYELDVPSESQGESLSF